MIKTHVYYHVEQGIWSRRYNRSLPDLSVDCWVRTEALDQDLARCLRQYEAQGGTLAAGASQFIEEHEDALRDQRVHPSSYDHPCSWFFSEGSKERAFINEINEPMCGVLEGGCDCCGKVPYPPVATGAMWPADFHVNPRVESEEEEYWNY